MFSSSQPTTRRRRRIGVLAASGAAVLALGLPNLTHLNLAFCGSAVSDTSLRCISLHLLELRNLSVRGCVRVTGTGVEAVVEGCRDLEVMDVSQCKNLGRWIEAGGVQMVRQRGRRGRRAIIDHFFAGTVPA